MKKLLTIIVLFCSLFANGQTETNDFTTYDTLIYSTYDIYDVKQFRLRISRPTNMFTNSLDSTSRPLIFFIPGQGQMGTNYANLQTHGPHYWLNNGWDGSITDGNGTHYPIIISGISNSASGQMSGREAAEMLSMILSIYHIKRNSVHVIGFSQGGFALSSSLYYERTPGDEFGMKQITSITCLQGVEETPTPSGAFKASYKAWGHWAVKYNGKAFCLEGSADPRNSQYMQAEFIDSSKAGNHYMGFETFGSGTHCCWNSMMDSAYKNWKSTVTYGPNNGGGGFSTSMGTYRVGQNIFEWMFAQGDTSFITGGSGGGTPGANAGSDQTLSNGTTSTTLNGSASVGTTYAWTRVSGPNTPAIVSASATTTSVTGMIAGTYVFRITVNGSLTDDVTVVIANSNVYIYPNTTDGVVITRSTYPLLTKGDTVLVSKKATGTGYNALIIANLFNNQIGPNPANQGDWITIKFASDAYMEETASDNQYSYVDSIYGVKLVGYKHVNRNAQPFRFGKYSGPSGFIQHFIIDSFKVINSVAFENSMYNNFPSMAGDTTKMHHHITWKNGIIQKSYGWPTGNYQQGAIRLGNAAKGGDDSVITRNIIIDNVFFDNWVSGNAVGGLTPGAGGFIFMGAVDSLVVSNCVMSNLGVNLYISAHAASINFHGNAHIYNNYFGPDNHSNEVRATGMDFAWHHIVGPVINIYNNLIISKRKYPGFELYDNSFTNTQLVAQRTIRRWFAVWNNTEFNGGIGAAGADGAAWGNVKYMRKGVLDFKGSTADTVTAKNNIAIMPPRDSTGATAACAVIAYDNGGFTADTSKNFTFLTWAQAGLVDSGNFVPSASSVLKDYGATVAAPVTTSGRYLAGFNRVSNSIIDVGGREYQVGGNAPPGVEAGPDQAITLPTNSVTMAGSATDPDGTVSSHTYTLVSGPNTPTITTPSSYTTTITGLIEGAYIFRLTAIDNSSASAYDDMTVVVNPVPEPARRPVKILKQSN